MPRWSAMSVTLLNENSTTFSLENPFFKLLATSYYSLRAEALSDRGSTEPLVYHKLCYTSHPLISSSPKPSSSASPTASFDQRPGSAPYRGGPQPQAPGFKWTYLIQLPTQYGSIVSPNKRPWRLYLNTSRTLRRSIKVESKDREVSVLQG